MLEQEKKEEYIDKPLIMFDGKYSTLVNFYELIALVTDDIFDELHDPCYIEEAVVIMTAILNFIAWGNCKIIFMSISAWDRQY